MSIPTPLTPPSSTQPLDEEIDWSRINPPRPPKKNQAAIERVRAIHLAELQMKTRQAKFKILQIGKGEEEGGEEVEPEYQRFKIVIDPPSSM
jgi:hypothetical protein